MLPTKSTYLFSRHLISSHYYGPSRENNHRQHKTPPPKQASEPIAKPPQTQPRRVPSEASRLSQSPPKDPASQPSSMINPIQLRKPRRHKREFSPFPFQRQSPSINVYPGPPFYSLSPSVCILHPESWSGGVWLLQLLAQSAPLRLLPLPLLVRAEADEGRDRDADYHDIA